MIEFRVKSEIDGLELVGSIIEPKRKARGIVQISHGMAEHKERYIPFMEFLSKEGYVVVIHDHRGHGKSLKSRADYGYFYDKTGIAIVEDLHQITMFAKKKYPKLPVYLLGHSMGSMVVRNYIKKYDRDIEKLIVCGSPSRNAKVGLAIFFTKVLIKIKGDRYRSGLIDKLTFGNYNKEFRDATSKNAWLCSVREVVEKYEKDEECGFIFTLNGFLNLFILNRDTYNEKDYYVRRPNLDILFIAGSLDPVILSKRDFEEAQVFLKNVGYERVRGILYKNMRHEILNEKDKQQVYQDILEFIKS